MTDASSADITRFLKWYIWVWLIGFVLMHTFKKCICNELASIPLPACLTLALCLDFNFNHWLIKEPVSKNPLKLIYRVMHYAWKNKYPRQRSAFTYCDDKRYSRMDFAKQKFGGPFTTEEVEDVKTFWRILKLFIIFSSYTGFIVNFQSVAQKMVYHLKIFRQDDTTECSGRFS